MDKMFAAFIAMGLMLFASFLITLARTKTRGIVRFFLSSIAYFCFVPILLYMFYALFKP